MTVEKDFVGSGVMLAGGLELLQEVTNRHAKIKMLAIYFILKFSCTEDSLHRIHQVVTLD